MKVLNNLHKKLFFLFFFISLSLSLGDTHAGNLQTDGKTVDDFPEYFSTLNFQKLAPFFDRQKTNSSCSLATITQIINAVLHLRSPQYPLASPVPLVTQEEVLAKVGSRNWGRAVRENGGGVGFVSFRRYLREALRAYKLGEFEMEIRQKSRRNLHLIREELGQSERSPHDFIIIYFISKRGLGHYSPLGGFLQEKDEVLIMDVKDVFYRSSIDDLIGQMVYGDMGYVRLRMSSL